MTMTADVTPFILGFGAMVGVFGGILFGWAIGNINNRVRMKRILFKKNLGVERIIGNGMQGTKKEVNLGDSLAEAGNKLLRIESLNKDGQPQFWIEDGVVQLLHNENQAIPLSLNSIEREIHLCPKCEREVDDPTEYVSDDKDKEPICPWGCEDEEGKVKLITKKVLSPVNLTTSASGETEHLFNLFWMIFGYAMSKAQKEFQKKLAELSLIKLLAIAACLLALAAVVVGYLNYQTGQEIIKNQLLQNVTAAIPKP